MSKKESKSNVTFLHEITQKTVQNGEVVILEEYIIHGDKGLLLKFYNKEGDKKEKLVAKMNTDGTFSVNVKENEKEDKMENMTKEELVKMLAKLPKLKFALDYLKKQKGGKRC
jgi:hypothetical protein